MTRKRILLADDHPLILEGSRAIFPKIHEIVGTVSDGRSLVEAALRLKPDLIILDIAMPLMNGIEAGRRIKASLPDVKLLYLTMHTERPYLQAAFEAGASGYLLKSAVHEELHDALRSVLEGRMYLAHSLSEYREHLRSPGQIVKSLKLSAREREVLQLISEGRSSKEIAGILNIAPKTVSFHRENVKRKLNIKTIAELTRTAIAGTFL